MSKYKAIFTDIDGTLFSHKSRRFPPSTLEAIKIIRKKGVQVFIASGRNYYLIKKSGILNYITPDGMITMNGIAVAWKRKILNRLVLLTVMEN